MLIIRHGEIYTKSDFVRKQFIKKLVNNLHLALPGVKIETKRWRIIIHDDSEKAVEAVKHVFGVVSFSKAVQTTSELEDIKEEVNKFIPKQGTFAIDTHRLYKNYHLTSQEVNEKIGEHVLQKNPFLKVNLKKPGTRIGIEIMKDTAYIYSGSIQGPGGLPLGSAGLRVKCSYENEFDLAAAWMMMKRGVIVVHFNEKLSKWSYGFSEREAVALVTGETRIQELIEKQKKEKQVMFSPLIGLKQEEVKQIIQKINK